MSQPSQESQEVTPPADRHVTYQLQYRMCGKPTCSVCPLGVGHGPYWYAYWRADGGRLRSAYIGRNEPADLTPAQRARAHAHATAVFQRRVLAQYSGATPGEVDGVLV